MIALGVVLLSLAAACGAFIWLYRNSYEEDDY